MVLVATQVKRRRGTTAENDAFTGAEGEITVDTEKHELRVHDGVTQGGFKIGGGSGALVVGQIIEVVGTADYTPEGCLLADGAEYTKAQFPDLWANFLTGTPKLQTCTYTEYANQIAGYGFCNKFAVDTTNETFKVPTRNKYRKLVKKIVNSNSWANLYDDGWVEQGGSADLTTTSGTLQTITLPITMADNRYTVTATEHCQTSGTGGYSVGWRSKTTTSFVLAGSSAGTNITNTWDWQVSGYAPIPDSTANITREFVVIANGTLNQEQMDWSSWASSLAGRATTDMNNITSTGKETVVGWGMPDYSAGISQVEDVEYTAPKAGVLYLNAQDYNTNTYITIDGEKMLLQSISSNQASSSCATYLIDKGSIYKVEFGRVITGQYITFYPCKGAN